MSNFTLTAIDAGDVCSAGTANSNFTNITDVINGKLDSDNYMVSSVKSKHIAANAIQSQHISDSNVPMNAIHDNAIRQTHVDFTTANAGLQALQYGTNMPANGLVAARMSTTLAVVSSTGTASASVNVKFSDAIDGDPGFTTDPIVQNPALLIAPGAASFWAGKTNGDPQGIQVVGLDSVSVDYKFYYKYAHEAHTLTIYVMAEGAK